MLGMYEVTEVSGRCAVVTGVKIHIISGYFFMAL